MKKYQGGGAVRAAKRMSKALKSVKTGKKAKTFYQPEYIRDTGKYVKNKNLSKLTNKKLSTSGQALTIKPLTKKYSKILEQAPSQKASTTDLYGRSPMKKALDKAKSRKPLSSSLKKKAQDNFFISQYNKTPNPFTNRVEKRTKSMLPKPKMVKGGTLRKSRNHL